MVARIDLGGPTLPVMLRTVVATRYVTPLREGGSLPALVEADARRPADEDRPGQRSQAMANEEDGGHGSQMLPRAAGDRDRVAGMIAGDG